MIPYDNGKCRPNRIKDISGKRFGKLVVVGIGGRTSKGKILWECKCDCGNTALVEKSKLGKYTNSCGCVRREVNRNRQLRHGQTKTRLHKLWCSMRQRCTEGGAERNVYFDRGISVCEEWSSYEAFRDWAMSHGYDPNAPRGTTTIDRINNDKGYSPDNCRFVTQTGNSRNRRTNRMVLVDGEKITMAEASERYGINYGTLEGRLDRGWSDEDAVKKPVRKGRFSHDGNKRVANY